MPRAPRIFGDDILYHVIIRCNNRERLLLDSQEFGCFSHQLADKRDRFRFLLYDYTLMHTHVHLLLSTHHGYHLDLIMRSLNLSFSKSYNTRYNRRGHFWRDRYWAHPVTTDSYALCCMRYLAWNAPRAGIIARPSDWPWCGYRFYALGERNSLLTPHPSYIALGNSDSVRQRHYRDFVHPPLYPDEEWLFLTRTRRASEKFQRVMHQHLHRLQHHCGMMITGT